MKGISDYLNLHATALTVRAKRNKVLASNIANAATPNFKARDIDFEQILKAKAGEGKLKRSYEQHFGFSGAASSDKLKFRQSMNPSADGNTVEMAIEQMEFSENSLRYISSLNFLNKRLSGLLTAIKGE